MSCLSLSIPNVSGVFSGPVLHPSFVVNYIVVFVESCWQTNQQMDIGEKTVNLDNLHHYQEPI